MTTLHNIRVFLAISLGPAQRSELQQSLNGLKQTLSAPALRWIPEENWHITLKFLGNTDLQQIPMLTTALEDELQQHSTFQLKLTRFDWFPSATKPTILAAFPEPCESLNRLAMAVDIILTQYGFRPETRNFRPHLSLARTRKGQRPKGIELLPIAIDPIIMGVEKIDLLQSQPKKQTVCYSKLASFPLLS